MTACCQSCHAKKVSNMLYRHVFGKIPSEFRTVSHVFANFADVPEFRGTATMRNRRISAIIMLDRKFLFLCVIKKYAAFLYLLLVHGDTVTV